jgi:hypothetical protein
MACSRAPALKPAPPRSALLSEAPSPVSKSVQQPPHGCSRGQDPRAVPLAVASTPQGSLHPIEELSHAMAQLSLSTKADGFLSLHATNQLALPGLQAPRRALTVTAQAAALKDMSGLLTLDNIRSALIRQEDTIIFHLIERAQYATNESVYAEGAISVPGAQAGMDASRRCIGIAYGCCSPLRAWGRAWHVLTLSPNLHVFSLRCEWAAVLLARICHP